MLHTLRASIASATLFIAVLAHADAKVEHWADRGIWPELDAQVPLGPPLTDDARAPAARLLIDASHGLATVFVGDAPIALYAYPLDAAARASLTRYTPALEEVHGTLTHEQDHDGDGIIDALDILRGAKKLLLNRAAYHERYVTLRYPGGDVPRTEGVCTDTIVRVLRNAGIDLQREVHDDIVAAPRAYPMVKKVDSNIDQRRVKTLLPWFRRHTRVLAPNVDYQPGDIVFFDTFPSKPGAEHVGVLSDRRAPDGNWLVINNWTDGAVDAEMPLLNWVPVTDHFRIARAPAK